MKKIIFLLMVFATLLNAQNNEPTPMKFFNTSPNNWSGANVNPSWEFSADNTDALLRAVNQDNFVIGWWWGSDIRSADNLNSNMAQGWIGANNNYWIFLLVPQLLLCNPDKSLPNVTFLSRSCGTRL